MIESWQHEHEELVDECEAAGRDIVSPSCRAPVGGPERTRSWRTMPWESADRCVRPSRCFAWLSSVELDVARLCAIQIWVGFRLWRGSDFGGVQISVRFSFEGLHCETEHSPGAGDLHLHPRLDSPQTVQAALHAAVGRPTDPWRMPDSDKECWSIGT